MVLWTDRGYSYYYLRYILWYKGRIPALHSTYSSQDLVSICYLHKIRPSILIELITSPS